jgi:hypothetical protein
MTNYMELHSPSTCRAPRAFDAGSPKVAAANAMLASPVPKAAAELRLAQPADNRCGARDEEDLPGSVPRQEMPSSPVSCAGVATLQSSNGRPLGCSGPDLLQDPPTSPEHHQEQAQQEDFSDRAARLPLCCARVIVKASPLFFLRRRVAGW